MFGLYAKVFGQAWAVDWQAGLTAPFVEESSKGLVFLLLMGLAPVVIRTAYDGLIVGAYVGLGFQVLEDMLYGQNAAAQSFGTNQVNNVLDSFVLRAATGVASHAVYTALFAAGVVYVIGTAAQPQRVGRGVLLMLTAVVVHGVWDATSAVADGNALIVIALIVGLTVLALLILMLAIRWGSGRERGYMRDILAPEVADGVLTELELEAVAGERKDKRADRRTARRADDVSRHREKRIIAAAHDLAEDLCASGGEDSKEVEHSRAEILRLRGLTT